MDVLMKVYQVAWKQSMVSDGLMMEVIVQYLHTVAGWIMAVAVNVVLYLLSKERAGREIQ